MTQTASSRRSTEELMRDRTPAQALSALVGAVFLLVGILGFIPGITTDYDEMAFAGPDSDAMLLGVFQVSVLHNIVHLLFGIGGFVLAATHVAARSYLVLGGLVYLALWIYGLIVDKASDANFVPVNTADDWLHFGLGAGMVLLGALAWSPATGRRA